MTAFGENSWYLGENLPGVPYTAIYDKIRRIQFREGLRGYKLISRKQFKRLMKMMIHHNNIDRVRSTTFDDHNLEGYHYSIRNKHNNIMNHQMAALSRIGASSATTKSIRS